MGGSFSLNYDNRGKTTHLYAQYKQDVSTPNTFTLIYNANGGAVTNSEGNKVFSYENRVQTTAASYEFNSIEAEREGYEFLG